MQLAIMGYLIIFAIMFLLIKGKASPIVLFVVIPIIGGLLAGYSIAELDEYIVEGVKGTLSNAVLFLFSVIFFGLMDDQGVFDPLVSFLIKKAGNNVILITVSTGIIAVVGHLDGSTASTVLITIPAMWPIYKKMKMSPYSLLTIIASAMGVMNLVPWGGPTARAATVLGVDATEIWHTMIPIQIVGLIMVIVIAVFLGIREKAKGAGVTIEELRAEGLITDEKIVIEKKTWANIILVVALIVGLVLDLITAYLFFMIATSIALVLNYKNPKEQTEALKKHAPNAFIISGTLIASGVFVGVLSGNENAMLNEMSLILLKIIPGFLAQYLHIIMGILGLPLGMVLGTDAFFYGLMPLCIEVGKEYGISAENMAYSMLIGKNLGLLVSPLVPATWLALGLVELEDIKPHIKFAFPILIVASICMVVAGLFLGIITL